MSKNWPVFFTAKSHVWPALVILFGNSFGENQQVSSRWPSLAQKNRALPSAVFARRCWGFLQGCQSIRSLVTTARTAHGCHFCHFSCFLPSKGDAKASKAHSCTANSSCWRISSTNAMPRLRGRAVPRASCIHSWQSCKCRGAASPSTSSMIPGAKDFRC